MISELKRCARCPRLAKMRSQVVPWEKPIESPRARVMFIGEAPGKVEDAKGKPFQGPSAKGFNALRSALGLRREEIYVTNAVKCFAPEWNANSKLGWQEIERCRSEWLLNEIAEFKPFMIVALGTTAMKALLDDKALKLNLTKKADQWPKIAEAKTNMVHILSDVEATNGNSFWLAPFWHPSPMNKWLFPQKQAELERHPLVARYRTLIDQARKN